MDSSVRLPAVRPVDEELHPLPPCHAANPPSLRPHLHEPRVLGDLGKWQARAQSGNKVAVLFESQVAARLMIRAANLAVAWASERAGEGGRWEPAEPRLTGPHSSKRRRAAGCQADKVKHCRDPDWMTRPFMPLNDFINLMSQTLVSWVPVTCHLS